ncbi:hypothetical protein GNI_021850, partial [Gregarina niphandrodes]
MSSNAFQFFISTSSVAVIPEDLRSRDRSDLKRYDLDGISELDKSILVLDLEEGEFVPRLGAIPARIIELPYRTKRPVAAKKHVRNHIEMVSKNKWIFGLPNLAGLVRYQRHLQRGDAPVGAAADVAEPLVGPGIRPVPRSPTVAPEMIGRWYKILVVCSICDIPRWRRLCGCGKCPAKRPYCPSIGLFHGSFRNFKSVTLPPVVVTTPHVIDQTALKALRKQSSCSVFETINWDVVILTPAVFEPPMVVTHGALARLRCRKLFVLLQDNEPPHNQRHCQNNKSGPEGTVSHSNEGSPRAKTANIDNLLKINAQNRLFDPRIETATGEECWDDKASHFYYEARAEFSKKEIPKPMKTNSDKRKDAASASDSSDYGIDDQEDSSESEGSMLDLRVWKKPACAAMSSPPDDDRQRDGQQDDQYDNQRGSVSRFNYVVMNISLDVPIHKMFRSYTYEPKCGAGSAWAVKRASEWTAAVARVLSGSGKNGDEKGGEKGGEKGDEKGDEKG